MTDANPEWLDPEEFPFTEAELFAALGPWGASLGHDRLPREIAQGLRECRVDRLRAAGAIARGSRDLEEINHAVFLFPPEVWALLCELSPAHAERVESFRDDRRRASRAHRLATAMHLAGLHPRATPTPEIVATIDAEDAAADEEWKAFRARVRRETPGATDGPETIDDVSS